jgi:hypothetical protein
MLSNKKFISAFAVFLVLIGTNANAEPVHACGFKCSNVDTQARVISMRYDQGDVFSMIDYKNKTAHTYISDKYFDNNGEMFDRTIKVGTSSVANNVLVAYLNVSAKAKTVKINVPANLPNTPNDDRYSSSTSLIISPQSRDHIAAWLAESAALQVQIETLFSELISSLLVGVISAGLDVKITVTFEDSSTGSFEGIMTVENGYLARDYSYINDSARFADGSVMPRALSNIVGDWAFNSEMDSISFIRLGNLWNVALQEAIECKPTKAYECRADSDGEVTCTTFQKCE